MIVEVELGGVKFLKAAASVAGPILGRARERAACLMSFELPLLHASFAEDQPIEADFFLNREGDE
ncbi:MAG: hypothetical protein QMC73_11550, partial [Myxococcota bacterium]